MLRIYCVSILALVLSIASASAEPKTEKAQIANTLQDAEEFDDRLNDIRGALASFRTLTELLRKNAKSKDDPNGAFSSPGTPRTARYRICEDALDLLSVGNLDWDIQTIGFANWTDLLQLHHKQAELESARLRLEIATLRKQAKEKQKYQDQVRVLEKELDVLLSREAAKVE